jgi:release factor glutamine methyltransferase
VATVRELLEKARRQLLAAGVERPGREAALLLRSLLGMSEAALLAHDRDPVPPQVAARFAKRVAARARHMPAAYVVGEREFFGRAFAVDARVLIPRPETEHLVELVLALPLPDRARVLDLGTGSGCVAVTLAAERPQWRLTASDLSPAALAVARRNAARHGVAPRVSLVAGDLTRGLLASSFDAVAVNPPYVDARSRTALAAEVRDHEPAPALFAERGGLAIFERLFGELAAAAPRFLACEVGAGQADDIVRLAERRGRWRLVARRRDFGGIERDLAWQRTA